MKLSVEAKEFINNLGLEIIKVQLEKLDETILGRYDGSKPGTILLNSELEYDQLSYDMTVVHEACHLLQWEQDTFFTFGYDEIDANILKAKDSISKRAGTYRDVNSPVECDAELAVIRYLYESQDFSTFKIQAYIILAAKNSREMENFMKIMKENKDFDKSFYNILDQIWQLVVSTNGYSC